MARKRLRPANPNLLQSSIEPPELLDPVTSGARRVNIPPIAQVAGEASSLHALQELAQDVENMRSDGRILLRLSLSDIALDHLARDRARVEPESFSELVNSIRTYGQRMPIEVTELPEPTEGGARFGLISGLRRMSALEHLYQETGNQDFAIVTALLRKPKDSADAYVAMVEENEIRVGLSYYERAGIALEVVRRGVFETEKVALNTLFASASRSKRSRIRAFCELHKKLGQHLKFPTSIPERFGLRLIYALREENSLAAHLKKTLVNASVASGEEEIFLLQEAIRDYRPQGDQKPFVPRAQQMVQKLPNGITVKMTSKKIELSGREVSPELFTDICALIEKL